MIATAGSTFLPERDRTDLDPAELLASTALDNSTRGRCFTHLLTGFHQLNHDGLAAAVVSLRQAVRLGESVSETDLLTNLGIATFHLGDDDGFRRCFTRLLTQARTDGAIGLVLFALPRLALADLSAGNWTGAVSHATEAVELARSTGQIGLTAMPLAELAVVAALRGEKRYDDLLLEVDRLSADEPAGILGVLMQDTRRWAQGCHAALTGQPAAALHHMEQMAQPTLTRLAGYDRLDLAVRTGHLDTAAHWLADLEQFATVTEMPHARSLVAYGHAVLASQADSPKAAEEFFVRALGGSTAGTVRSNGPVPTSPTGSFSADPAAGSTPENSCGRHCKPSKISTPTLGWTGRSRNSGPPVRPPENAMRRPASRSPRRRGRSLPVSHRGFPTVRSPPSCFSAPEPSISTCGTSSPKRVSPRGANSRGSTSVSSRLPRQCMCIRA